MPEPQNNLTGKIAVTKGFLSKQQLTECVNLLTTAPEEKHLMDVAREKGYLTGFQVEQILKEAERAIIKTDPIPGFKLLAELGQGGMGKVYKATQKSLNRTVAIKILPASLAKNPDYIERFKREARSAGQLTHPNVVQVIQVGETAQRHHYIVMEYVDGPTVETLLKRNKRLPEAQAIEIVKQVALALSEAGRLNLIHRDIKPGNIILTKEGVSKLADFGLAREEQDNSVTQTGALMGTPHYMSPEQARGVKDIDIRTDIYSLGVTLYHMLVGEVPFAGETATATILMHIEDPPVPPKERVADISGPLNDVILKMLSKNREERYANPGELLIALQHVAQPATTVKSTANADNVTAATTPPVSAGMRRNHVIAGIAGFMFMLLVVLAVTSTRRKETKEIELAPQGSTAPIEEAATTAHVQRKRGAPSVKPEDIAPTSPPAPASVNEIFHGRVAEYLPDKRRIRLHYAFDSQDELKDWEVFTRQIFHSKDLYTLEDGAVKLDSGSVIAHKAVFKDDMVIEAQIGPANSASFVLAGKDGRDTGAQELWMGWHAKQGEWTAYGRIGTKTLTESFERPAAHDNIHVVANLRNRIASMSIAGWKHEFPAMLPDDFPEYGQFRIVSPPAKFREPRLRDRIKSRLGGMPGLTVYSVTINGVLDQDWLEKATQD